MKLATTLDATAVAALTTPTGADEGVRSNQLLPKGTGERLDLSVSSGRTFTAALRSGRSSFRSPP